MGKLITTFTGQDGEDTANYMYDFGPANGRSFTPEECSCLLGSSRIVVVSTGRGKNRGAVVFKGDAEEEGLPVNRIATLVCDTKGAIVRGNAIVCESSEEAEMVNKMVNHR